MNLSQNTNGPRFTKPSWRNLLCNIPLSLAASVLVILFSIRREVSAGDTAMILSVALVTFAAAFVASAFVHGAYDVLRGKITFYTLPFSLAVSAVAVFLFSRTRYFVLAGEHSGAVLWLFIGVIWLVAAFYMMYALNWILVRNDGQEELCARVLRSKALRTVIVCCIAAAAVLFVVFAFDSYFWQDESFTLRLISLSYPDGIDITAHDTHPPLYYLMLKTWVSVFSFGSKNIAVMVVLSRLFSFLAYILTAVLCWKKLASSSISSSRSLLLLCLFASSAFLRFGTEIRMYGWAMLFVTAAFFYARDVILGRGGWRTWSIITFFTICAAYTHYFALIAVVVIWLVLLIWLLLRDKRLAVKWIVCAVISAAAFFPWFIVLLHQAGRVAADGFWIEFQKDIAIRTCVYLLIPNAVLPFVLLKIWRTNDGKRVSFEEIFGLIVPLATMLAGIVLSLLIRPVFISKYLIPSALCVWISLFFIIRHGRAKEKFIVACTILLSFLICGCIGMNEFANDCKQMKATRQTLAKIDKGEPLCVCDTETFPDVLSLLTKNNIYTPLFWDLGDKTAKLFPNIINFEDENEMCDYVVESGKEVYAVVPAETENVEEYCNKLMPAGYSKVYIGDWTVDTSYRIYKLVPLR